MIQLEPEEEEEDLQRQPLEVEVEEPLQIKEASSRYHGLQTTHVQTHTVDSSADPLEQEASYATKGVVGVDRNLGTRPQISTLSKTPIGGEWQDVRQNENFNAGSPQTSSEFQDSLRSEESSGRPLPQAARTFFEPRFGSSFEHVGIHDDSRAAALSSEINARAFTHGKHIYFAAGQYDLKSTEGRRLVAHELTHTLQQGFRKPHPTALSTRTFPTKAGQFGLLSHTLARQIQRWEDVYPGGIRSYSTWSGAKGAIRRLQPKHPRLKYRIIRRGRNFVIQSRTAGAGSRSFSTKEERKRTTDVPRFLKFTFDDGPRGVTPSILSTLSHYSIKAGFFICGRDRDLSKVSSIIKDGHIVGNHTWNHKGKGIQFKKLHDEIFKNNGYKMTYWRAPFGNVTASLEKMRKKLKYKPHTDWQYDTLDWRMERVKGSLDKIREVKIVEEKEKGKVKKRKVVLRTFPSAEETAKFILNKRIIKGGRKSGNGVVLMHEKPASADILPKLLELITIAKIPIKNFP